MLSTTVIVRPPGFTVSCPDSATRLVEVTVTVTLEDTPVGTVIVPPGTDFRDYTINVPAGIAKSSGSLPDEALLHIRAPTWSADQAGLSYDTRALGIQLDRVTLSK